MTNLTTIPSAGATTAEPPAPAKETGRRVNPLGGVAHLALFLWALATVGPLIWVALASFKTNEEIFLDEPFGLPQSWAFKNFADAWSEAHIGQYFLNSVFVVLLSTAGTMLLGSMAAYVLARYRFPGNRFIYYLFVSGLAFPTFMALAPLFGIAQAMNLLDSFFGLIVIYIAYSLSFTVFFLVAFFRTLPHEIEEAATVDGAGHVRRFFQVMLPMAKSGLVSIAIFNIVGQWNQYLLPVVIMQSEDKYVLTQGIANISVSAGYQAEWGQLFAALTLSILPMIIVYAVFQRQIQAGLTSGAVK
ncbi:sugar ABC transporter permease [Actinoplanes philippinensis]|uniref:N-acetylglucosamine transport system permease protein n=1 Tax=Actinoplanes philippinensis TaxID=35752 RepID=A0A1I2B622_9ACTN|nr:carbohydrate ABC transporter permease [Actinoplanes philippinensis]GIE75720.1 sugar ABC transporter permease [Actinoplanes philippinensis]SFE51642.1 N-acetylglucosamine transport system permease protein [Actinoplanes philippinensis]